MKTTLERDGRIAVVYSPGYGAGLSTSWNPNIDVTDSILAGLVLEGEHDKVIAYLSEKYPDAYLSEGLKLAVEWVTIGKHYKVREYDGAEWVEVFTPEEWAVALPTPPLGYRSA